MKVGSMLLLRVAGCAGGRGATKSKKGFGRWLMLLGLLCLLGSADARAQQVSGTVRDAQTGDPLPGVNVVVKGTTLGTATDLEGRYSLTVPSLQDTLVFSFVGYVTREEPIAGRSVVDVSLTPTVIRGEEIVVIGYGTQRREDITSAVAKVTSEDFRLGQVKSALELVKGKIAGVNIGTPSGNPNAGVEINIRGVTTLSGDRAPLIVIDGVPGGSLSSIAPEDIESIDVLKDASAAAIYGTRGTNGVILITTKKERGTGTRVDYHGYASYQTILRKIEVFSAEEYRQINAGEHPIGQAGVRVADFGYNTDWFDLVTRNPWNMTHYLSVANSGRAGNVVASFTYRGQNGLFYKSDREEVIGRVAYDQFFWDDRVNVEATVTQSIISYRELGSAGDAGNVYRQAIWRNPTDRPKDDNGNWIERPVFQYYNPVAMLEETINHNKANVLLATGRVRIEPMEGMFLGTMLATQRTQFINGYYETHRHFSTTFNGVNGYASRFTSWDVSRNWELTAEYEKDFKDHRFKILGGYNYQDFEYESFNANNRIFPSDAFTYNNLSVGEGLGQGRAGMDSYKSMNKLIAFFGRINYAFKDRYLFNASVRREGSSKFGKNHKWGWFPAISAGWRLGQEPFIRNALNFVDDLKLRIGFGVTGSEPTDPYLSLTRLTYGARMLNNGVWVQGVVPASNPNPDLRWERKEEWNVGLDFSFMQGRISGSLDFYKRTTKDLLWEYSVPVPPYLYNRILANVGTIENRGYELSLNLMPINRPGLTWNLSFNASHNSNKLVSLTNDQFQLATDYINLGYTGDPIQTYTHRIRIGGAVGEFYAWKVLGVDENGKWIIENVNGDVDEQGNPIIDENDRQVVGNGIPKLFAALSSELTVGNFDVSVLLRGAFGHKVLNFLRMHYEYIDILANYNIPKTVMDQLKDFGQFVRDTPQYVDYFLEDGDYVKIDNITIGYNWRPPVPHVSNMRIYVAGNNLHVFTKYKGIDPEVPFTGLTPGYDHRDIYPTVRTYTIGVQISFN